MATARRELPLLPAEKGAEAAVLKLPTSLISELRHAGRTEGLQLRSEGNGRIVITTGQGKTYTFKEERGMKPARLVQDDGSSMQALGRASVRYIVDTAFSQGLVNRGNQQKMETAGDKRSAPPGVAAAPGAKKAKISGYVLRQVVGWLALEPLTLRQVEGQVKVKDIGDAVESVADLGPDKRYYLKMEELCRFDVGGFGDAYTPDEARRASEHVNRALAGDYPFEEALSDKDKAGSDEKKEEIPAAKPPTASAKPPAASPNRLVASQSVSSLGSTLSAVPKAGGRGATPSEQPTFEGDQAMLKKWPAVTTAAQYDEYCATFKKMYEGYRAVDVELTKHIQRFDLLGQKLKKARTDVDREVVEAEITNLYQVKGADVEKKQQQYRALHEELKAIKYRIKVYALSAADTNA